MIRRLLRYAMYLLLLLVVAAGGAVAVFTQLEAGRERLAGFVSRQVSAPGRTVRISDLGGLLSGRLRAGEVSVEDGRGRWLSLRGVEVDWSPLRLLDRSFEASRIHAARVELSRLPDPSPQPASDEPFSLPVSVRVDLIDLPELAIGEAVAGVAATLSATGSAQADDEPLTIGADLDLARTDGPQATLGAKIDFAPGENRLQVDLEGSERDGGLLASLLRLPGSPNVDLAVSGSGPLADWKGKGTLSIDGNVITTLTVAHAQSAGTRRVTVNGEGSFGGFLPQNLAVLAQGAAFIDMALVLAPDGGVDIEHAVVESDRISAKGSGRVDPGGSSDLEAEFSARGEPVEIAFGAPSDPILLGFRRATLSASGTGAAPKVDIVADLSSVQAAGFGVSDLAATIASQAFDIASLTGPVAVDLQAGAVGATNAEIAPLVAGPLEAHAEAVVAPERIEITALSLRNRQIGLGASALLDRADNALAADFSADIVAAALPQAASGALGERVAISGKASRSGAGALSLAGLTLTSGPLSAGGDASLADGRVSAKLSGAYADIARVAPQASGAIRFDVSASGDVAKPEVSVALGSERLESAGRAATGVVVTANGVVDLDNPAAQVTLKATYGGEVIDGKATLRSADGRRLIDDLVVSIGQNRISGTLDLDEAFVPAGTLDLTLPDIHALAAMAGEDVSGDAGGKLLFARDGNGLPQLSLDLTSAAVLRGDIGARNLSVSATVANYLKAPVVAGSVKAGTLVAGATEIGDVSVDISRDGDWIAFDGGLSLADVPATAKGRARIVEAGGESRLEIDATTGISGLLPEYLRSLTGEALDLDVSALLLDGGAIGIERAVAQSPAITLSASGRYDPSGDSDIAVSAVARGEPVEIALGVAQEAPVIVFRGATADIAGPMASPRLDIEVDLPSAQGEGFGAADVKARLSTPAFNVASRTGEFSIAVQSGGLGAENAALAPLLAGALDARIEASVEAERVTVSRMSAKNAQFTLGLSGAFERETLALRATVEADILAAALPKAATGALGERVTVSAALSRSGEGGLAANDVRLSSGPLQAGGTASLSGDALTAALSGGFADLSLLAPDARGSVTFDARASGALTRPELSLSVASDRIESAGRAITDLRLTATGAADAANPVADVSLSGAIEGEAIEGKATLRSTGGKSRVEQLLVSVGENRISGSLDLDESFVPVGTLELSLPDVGPLAAMALEDVSGDVSGRIVFARGSGGAPGVSVDARVGAFARGDVSGRDIAVTAEVRDYLASPSVAGTVKAASVRSGDTEISAIDLELTRDGDWTGFDGGARVAGIPASAAGRVRVSGGETTVELRSAGGAFRGVSASLARPATVVVRDGSTRLDRLALSLSGGNAEISGTAGTALDLRVRLSGVPASLVNGFAPGIGAAGTISGAVSVAGAPASPRIGYDVDWRGAATAQTRDAGLGAFSIASSGTFDAGRLAFRANANDGAGLAIEGGGSVNTAGAIGLDLRFTGRAPFTLITRRIAAQGLSLTGGADLELAVSGTAAQPLISGSVRASGARFLDARSGIAINDLSADIVLARSVATIRSLTGTLSTGGSLSAGGTVGIDPASGFPADLTIRLADGRYTDGRVVTTTLNGDLKVSGPLVSDPLLSGRIALGRTVITVPEKLPSSLAAIDVKHRNASQAVREQAAALKPVAAASGGGGGLRLDITVDAPQRIFIQGRGLDAELGGSIRLTGSVANPVAIGRFDLRRGRLSILAKRIEMTSGTIGFEGSLIPRISFVASAAASDATATISVAGEANDPKFEFSSSPTLPQDEILARLVFGRSMSNLSPLQIAQLAEAAAQLAGIGGSTSLLQALQNRIGVDDLDIKTDEETGRAAVAVGKYLNDRTYVGIEKGEGAGTGKATIDLSIGKGVKLRGEARDDGRAKGGIFFEREY